jgi:hypothetical protein
VERRFGRGSISFQGSVDLAARRSGRKAAVPGYAVDDQAAMKVAHERVEVIYVGNGRCSLGNTERLGHTFATLGAWC